MSSIARSRLYRPAWHLSRGDRWLGRFPSAASRRRSLGCSVVRGLRLAAFVRHDAITLAAALRETLAGGAAQGLLVLGGFLGGLPLHDETGARLCFCSRHKSIARPCVRGR